MSKKQHRITKLTIVIPVHNEMESIESFFKRLESMLSKLEGIEKEIIFIEDGSTDSSGELLLDIAQKHKNIKVIFLTRNFGKEVALSAGMHAATGDAVLLIDADGQHPPELVPSFLEKFEEGYSMVVGLRNDNADEKRIKKIGNILYYKLLKIVGISHLQAGVTDFRVVGREVVDEFSSLQEHRRITRGLLDWLGFQTAYIPFDAPSRLAGGASYGTLKLAYLAIDSILSNSRKPLVLSLVTGVFISFFGLFGALFITADKFFLGDNLRSTGSAALVLLAIVLIGMVMVGQGIASLYLARIYEESQRRPLYVINKSKSKL